MIQKTMDVNSWSRPAKLATSGWALVMAKVPHVDVHVEQENLYDGAAQVIASIRPKWKLSDVKYKLFTDGITNKLIHCSVPDDVLLIRVYGKNTDLLIDRGAETRNIKLLERARLAPRLFATFNNGLAYEFAPGATLDAASVRDPAVFPLVARRVAQLHALSPEEDLLIQPHQLRPVLWDILDKYLSLLRDGAKAGAQEHRFSQDFGGLERLESEIRDLQNQLSPLGSPLVMCHNDLLLANVILSPNRSNVVFIDYEYAGLNYQAFDIGNHFAEFAGVATVDYTLYPDKDLQTKWLEIYLEEYNKLQVGNNTSTKVNRKDVEQLYVQVNKFALASHLMWGLWALVQSEHSAIKFDFYEYATIRLKEYFAKKSLFLSLEISS
ncbi:ethanolamine kinase 1 [Frankliniella occidentalis]|uniref:ethanolamine kinase n=1 Tax=Frankliniella occidentalis TaxID=133901 RepID=A0A6J1RTP8_FRAOC|nr:ethanolamine kinase 1 [Frankliniella occidentalis]